MTANRGGRPKREPKSGERVQLGLRVTPDLKGLLDGAAEQSGRSQSQEAEFRLENTFRDQTRFDHGEELVHGRQLAGILTLLGRVMKDAGSFAAFQESPTIEAAANWTESGEGMREAIRAALTVLAALGDDVSLAPTGDSLGVRLARGAMEAVANPERGGAIGAWAAPVRARLGALADRISIDLTEPISVVAMRPETGTAMTMTMGKDKDESQ